MPERRRLPRNPVANSPLLRKGGVHQRPRSGQRQLDKQVLNDALDEWLDERDDVEDWSNIKDFSPDTC